MIIFSRACTDFDSACSWQKEITYHDKTKDSSGGGGDRRFVLYYTVRHSVVRHDRYFDRRERFSDRDAFICGSGTSAAVSDVHEIRRALFYRRQRADAVALGNAAYGRIVGVTRQDVPYYTPGRHSHLSYRRYYYLNVEMTDPSTGITTSIQSQGYRRPIHRYLRSNKVKVYTDKSGWKHYLEDFQWKEHRSDPDLFDCSREFEEAHPWNGRIGQIIVTAVLVLMILNLFLNL